MCYAIPGKIVSIAAGKVIIDYFGETREALHEMRNLKKGDYIYAQGGMVIEKISKKEAAFVLKAWKERFFTLQKLDSSLVQQEESAIPESLSLRALDRASEGHRLSTKEILRLLNIENSTLLQRLFQAANRIRHQWLKNSCCVHGIIEFSNYCRNDCLYCGIRCGNQNIQRYRMCVDEIVHAAEYAVNTLGFKALVLQSGEDLWYTDSLLVEIVQKIKERCGVLLFMSIGNRGAACYKKLYAAGARGVLLRFETSNEKIYHAVHQGAKADMPARIELLHALKKMGYLVVSGSLIGLPGQTPEDILKDILFTKELGVDMYSFGPFIPHADTPLRTTEAPQLDAVLKVIAVCRLLDPEAKILVTTALQTLDRTHGTKSGLLAGANSLMINVTPQAYKSLYSLYPKRAGSDQTIQESIRDTLQVLYSLGRAPTDLGR